MHTTRVVKAAEKYVSRRNCVKNFSCEQSSKAIASNCTDAIYTKLTLFLDKVMGGPIATISGKYFLDGGAYITPLIVYL